MADTDKFHIDVQGTVVTLSQQLQDIAILWGRVIPDRLGQRALPLGNTSKKPNILARKVVEERELLQRDRIMLQEVLEITGGRDAVPRWGGCMPPRHWSTSSLTSRTTPGSMQSLETAIQRQTSCLSAPSL